MHYKAKSVHTGAIDRRLVIVVALAAITFGCTSMKAYTADDYDRAGSTSEKYYKDSRACDKQAEAHGKEHGYGPYDPTSGAYNRMYDACMRSSGYARKAATQ
jgi:hypothetical protein